jgi:hypothetical protein
MRDILHICCQILRTSFGLRYVNSGPCQIQRYCSFGDSARYTQLKSPRFPFQIYRQLDTRSTPNLLPNIVRINWVLLCQSWSLSNPLYLQFSILRIKYSIKHISTAIEGILTIRCALYYTFAAKYGADQLVCAM